MFDRGKISRAINPGEAAAFAHELRWDDLVAQLAANRDLREEAGRRDGQSGRFVSLNTEHNDTGVTGAMFSPGHAATARQREGWREQREERQDAGVRRQSSPARPSGSMHAPSAWRPGPAFPSPFTQPREQDAP